MISRIAVKNFRSLRDVELRPGPLTVLIGPNGAGKSNIIDALRFLKGVYWDWAQSKGLLGPQLEERGGFGQVVWGGLTDQDLEFEIEFSHNDGVTNVPGFRTRIECDDDSIRDFPLSRTLPIGSDKWEEGTYINGVNSEYLKAVSPLQEWQFYNFSPALMRKPTPVREEHVLNETGSNLSSVIHTLFSEGHPDLEEAVGMLKVMVPSVERLVSPIFGDGHTYVSLKEKGVKNPVGAWGLSDGTLLALALSVALAVRPYPDLICLETPESEIHPRMMEAVSDLLEPTSHSTQIIVTTQSPYLLDWLPYDSFVVVDKEEGETKLKPLKDNDLLRETVAALGAGPAWYSGYLSEAP